MSENELSRVSNFLRQNNFAHHVDMNANYANLFCADIQERVAQLQVATAQKTIDVVLPKIIFREAAVQIGSGEIDLEVKLQFDLKDKQILTLEAIIQSENDITSHF